MQRETVETVAIAVLCILALSVAAATLESSTAGGDGGGLVGDLLEWLPIPDPMAQERSADAGVAPADGALEDGLGPLRALFCIPALRDPAVQLAILAVVLVVAAVVLRRGDVLQWATTFAVVAAPGVLFLFVLDFTLRGCTVAFADVPGGGLDGGLGGASGPGEGVVPVGADPRLLLLAAVGLAVVAALAALAGSAGDDDAGAEEGEPERSRGTLTPMAAIADAAGAAADRIEASGEVDNEVYRAWREMTAQLDVANPEASTPAEFREAAIAAGMAPPDVDALTDVFEAVRYGGAPATAEREERAVDALRRIEATYGDGRD